MARTWTETADLPISAKSPRRDLSDFESFGKAAHDDIIQRVYRTQADALEIEAGAKRRLADEYDAAQERGEVKRAGNPNSSQTEELPGPRDIGLSYTLRPRARGASVLPGNMIIFITASSTRAGSIHQ